jgi:type II secretory pathway component PulC
VKKRRAKKPQRPNYFPYALGGAAILLAALGGYFVGTRQTSVVTVAPEMKEEGVRGPSTTIPASDTAKPEYSEPGLQRFADRVLITRTFWTNFLDNDASEAFFRSSETEPFTADGDLQGMKITKLDSTSLISKIGLKQGDILEEVNDLPFTDAETILEDLRSKRDMTKVTFHAMRAGKTFDTVMEIQ